jgi:hypothetical protein
MGKAKRGRALSKKARVDPLQGAADGKPQEGSGATKAQALALVEEVRGGLPLSTSRVRA